ILKRCSRPRRCAVTHSHFRTRTRTPPPAFTFFFFNDPAPTQIYTLSLHGRSSDLPAGASSRCPRSSPTKPSFTPPPICARRSCRSEEHTSELQSLAYLVCRLLLEKKKKKQTSQLGQS